MPVQIGAKTYDFSDPTGLLSDCHRRIEMFLGSLAGVARVVDHPLTKETRGALESALRYFREAAPKHTADEEESLFPRLRQIMQPEIQSAIERLEPLERDHLVANTLHSRVEQLGEKYLAERCLSLEEASAFRESVASLASIYQQHIKIEDDLVFPIAKQVLPIAEKEIIAKEMAARRNVRTVLKNSDVQQNPSENVGRSHKRL